MQINNFETTGLDKVKSWVKKNKINNLDKDTIKEALKRVNLSFVAEGINRVHSTLLCELKDSYVQQSQRYVTMKDDLYLLPDISSEDRKKADELIDKTFDLYNRMSELKEDDFKGRPKVEHYKYGIPIEDARYILPLATKTNISVAMTGNKLYELFNLLYDKEYFNLFDQFRTKIINCLPDFLVQLLPTEYSNNNTVIEDLYENDMRKINSDNKMVLLDSFNDLDLKVGLGAATSTSSLTPTEKLADWGAEATAKAKGLTERVLGYGHESIAEQARTTFGMMCSMVTYHQQIRHRLSENHREDLANLILETREVLLPPSIKESKFEQEFLELVTEFKEFRHYILENYDTDKAFPFILNCDQIKLTISTNARIDIEMLAERICKNAQWEIRELSTKKLDILRELSDTLYEKALPSCIYGKCKEGKLTCGQQKEMRDKFLREDK
ncbi:FAD-dependent thymidylate synthase [Halanaerocella petrolearia]